jgi:hypothetical protein
VPHIPACGGFLLVRPLALPLLKSRTTATLYAKRTRRGRFKEMDEKGRSLAADRRRKAWTKVKSGGRIAARRVADRDRRRR